MKYQMLNAPYPFYLGYDSREDLVYQVARHSLLKTSPKLFNVLPLVQDKLRADRIYTRPKDLLAATDFSLTRFMVPHIESLGFGKKHKFAIFADCDFLFTKSLELLMMAIERCNNRAVWVVKHDYTPRTGLKMGGKSQSQYPRKNWSSFMVFNLEHPATQALTKEVVNKASPSYLHRFQWCKDEEIGNLDITYNFLVGEYDKPEGWDSSHAALNTPACLHYTLGIGVFDKLETYDFAGLWETAKNNYLEDQLLCAR